MTHVPSCFLNVMITVVSACVVATFIILRLYTKLCCVSIVSGEGAGAAQSFAMSLGEIQDCQ